MSTKLGRQPVLRGSVRTTVSLRAAVTQRVSPSSVSNDGFVAIGAHSAVADSPERDMQTVTGVVRNIATITTQTRSRGTP